MTDSQDYRLYLEERFEGIASLMNAHFKNVDDRLEKIEIQTTKTNGRVTELEKEVRNDLPHTVDGCPQRGVINEIHEFVVAEKVLKEKTKEDKEIGHSDKVRWIMVIGIMVSVGLSILNNYKTNHNNTTLKGLKNEVDMINTPVRTRGGVIQWYPSGVVIDSLNKIK